MFKTVRKSFSIFFLASYLLTGLSPVAFSAETLNVIAVGDTGGGNKNQQIVADAMAKIAERESVSFILLLGDNFYIAGVKSVRDEQWKRKFEKVYHHPSLQIPFYAVLGNHDYGKNPEAQVKYTGKSPRWKMPAKYYTFNQKIEDGKEIQFFGLDTHIMVKRKSKRKIQLKWFKQALADSKAHWKIVFAHHPVYAGGKHGDTEGFEKWLEPLLIDYKVDLYVSGHEHVLEALKPVSGVHYLVSGTGSGPTRIKQSSKDLFAKSALGFALLRISKEKIDVELINGKNVELLYKYSIVKAGQQGT